MLLLTYERDGAVYSYLRSNNPKFIKNWLRWMRPGFRVISVTEVSK